MKLKHGVLLVGSGVLLAGGISVLGPRQARSQTPKGGTSDLVANKILARELAIELGQQSPLAKATESKSLAPVSGSVMTTLLERLDAGRVQLQLQTQSGRNGNDDAQTTGVPVPPSRLGSQGCPNVFEGRDSDNDGRDGKGGIANIRVNQDCTLRRQAEQVVVVNPRDFSNLVAGQNDSRIGFNKCGYDWSLDRGATWGDTGTAPPPFYQEVLADGHTADACSDPSATFDHLGNAYITGVFFDVLSPASAIFVAKSNAPIKGRFYHTPRPLSFQEYRATPMGTVGSDADPDVFHDKELMIADTRRASPKKGNVYVTWTRFETNATPVGGRSPIVFSQSKDGGATWSRAVIISGASGTFCTGFSGTPDSPNACDQDQGSHPVVGPDGTIYVIFGNGNVPGAGINQVLMVKCLASSSCELETDWLGPFLVGELILTHPIGPSAEGCPAGRQCLPPNGYRVPGVTSLSISVDKFSNLYATWADFRNGKSPCTPLSPAATARPPCNNDVFYAYSTNGGATWSPAFNVTAGKPFGETAQWLPWHDVTGDGSKVQIAFYDRHYGNCEFSGCNDITLATLSNPRRPNPSIRFKRITTSSMPNLTTANNPIQSGFLGDYIWVEVSRHHFDQRTTHIVWADTRQLFGPAPEEDIYYARVGDDDSGRGGDD